MSRFIYPLLGGAALSVAGFVATKPKRITNKELKKNRIGVGTGAAIGTTIGLGGNVIKSRKINKIMDFNDQQLSSVSNSMSYYDKNSRKVLKKINTPAALRVAKSAIIQDKGTMAASRIALNFQYVAEAAKARRFEIPKKLVVPFLEFSSLERLVKGIRK